MAPPSPTAPKGAPQTLPPPLHVRKYSDSLTLYSSPPSPGCGPSARPLLLFLPWLGSKPKSHEKYIRLYFKLGFDVLVAESSLLHFLRPRTGLEHAKDLLDLLMAKEELSCRRLFLHAMSIGGYTFAQMLVGSSKAQRKMLERIHGQVYDSLVVGSMEKMAAGVARMLSPPLLQPLVVRGTLLYFSLLKAQTTDYYEKGVGTFWGSPVPCPALFFYCLNDPLSDHAVVEELLQFWEKRGIRVQGKKWENSVHAGHLRRHKDEYIETLSGFIGGLLNNAPPSRL